MSFASLGLDPLAVQCAKRCGFYQPTPIQQSCIPAILKGLDVLALSKTGTGKTAAYLLPILHNLLSMDTSQLRSWSIVILVPTKELILQVPTGCQCILMSATRSSDLDSIVKLVMQNPHSIDLITGNQSQGDTIMHYYLQCLKGDAGVHLLALLKFQIVQRPVMIFVNSIKEGYRLKLFLECFKIPNAVLHRALPQKTRQNLINDFNGGRFSVFIVVDDLQLQQETQLQKQKRSKNTFKEKSPKEVEFGVARGLDFKNVQTLINYNLPQTINGYLHRVGRTGRAGHNGIALSFFTPEDVHLLHDVTHHLEENGSRAGLHLFPHLGPQQVSALKYRASNVMQSIHNRSIDAARRRDLKTEMLRSADLETYFLQHPIEKSLLESMNSQHPKRHFQGIDAFPSYIAPPEPQAAGSESEKKRRKTIPKIDPLTRKRLSKKTSSKKRRE